MPKITFTEKFNWTDPRLPQVTTAYKAGHTYMVTTPCANVAISQGKAKPVVGAITTLQTEVQNNRVRNSPSLMGAPIEAPEPEQAHDAESSVSG